jgi:hypothetical protein
VVVVFGLGPAGQLLGWLMKPILTYLAFIGIHNMMYVNNRRVNAATKERADRDYATTIEVFSKAGFTVAKEKSDGLGQSAQRKDHLGFTIETKEMCVFVPEQKLARILGILDIFLKKDRHRVRDITIVVGKLISLEPALGRMILVGTRLATIAFVAATDVTEAVKRRLIPWSRFIDLDGETLAAFFYTKRYVYFMKPSSPFPAYNSVYNYAASGSDGPLFSARCRLTSPSAMSSRSSSILILNLGLWN